MSGDNKPTLAYWDIRGLAEPMRMLLKYCKVDFVDKGYECGPGPEFSTECWTNEKFTLGLPFPNLPYYIDGDVKVTQSNAILRNIARKHGFCGKTEAEMTRVDIMENQLMDFRNGWVRLCYMTFSAKKDSYMKEELPATLKQFSEFLGDNKWFAGENLTFVDFVAYELFDQHQLLAPTCLDEFKNLKEFCERFAALPEIKAYFGAPDYKKRPINNKRAKFGAEVL